MMQYITKYVLTTASNGRTYFQCTYLGVMPSIFLRIGSYWIEVQPAHYTRVSSGDTCEIMLAYNEGFWALGLPVLKGYYVVFDVAND